ncbi:MAG: hypothetical protein ACK4QP_13110 [Pseudorhizobium sp.]
MEGADLQRIVVSLFKAFVTLGMLTLLGLWCLFGILLYMLPALAAAALFRDDAGAAVGAYMGVLIATGILSFKWNGLSRAVDVFHICRRVLLASVEKIVAEVEQLASR